MTIFRAFGVTLGFILHFVSKIHLNSLLLFLSFLSFLSFLILLNSYLAIFLQVQKRLIESSLLQFILPYIFSVAYLLTLSKHEKDLKNIIVVLTPIAVFLSFTLGYNFGLIGVNMAISVINVYAYIMVVKRLEFHTINFYFNVIKA